MTPRGQVPVLEPTESHALGASVRSVGFVEVAARDVAELERILVERPCPIAVLAFEALLPDPQRALRTLRDAAPTAVLVVVCQDSGPRIRLAQRLYAVGAFDHLVPRSALGDALPNLLRQATADATLLGLTAATDDRQDDPFRMLQALSAALANHRDVDSLLGELRRRLPHLMSFEVLEIVFTLRERPVVYVFQRTPLPLEIVTSLAERAFDALAQLGGEGLDPVTAELVHADPAEAWSPEPERFGESVLAPMMFCGQIVGCVAVLARADDPAIARERQLLQLLAHQLSIGLLHAHSLERAEAASHTDPMTGLHNRRHLELVLRDEWERCVRYRLQLSVLILDIDHFKQVNDVHGHLVGDVAIRRVAEVIRTVARASDVVVRWGGEEFLVMMPETNVAGASILFERIRVALKTAPLEVGEHVPRLQLAVSGGLAAYPMNLVATPEVLIELADDALLEAKRGGRDRLCFADGVALRDLDDRVGPDDGGEENKRRYPRISCALPITFVPLRELDTSAALDLATVNISASGIAVRDASRRIERNSLGLVYFEDRQAPFLGKVRWVRDAATDALAGIELIRPSGILQPGQPPGVGGRALVLADNPATLRLAMRSLRSNRIDVDSFQTTDAVPAGLDAGAYSLVVMSESALGSPVGRAVLAARNAGERAVQLVVIGESGNRQEAVDLIGTQRVQHLISDQARPGHSLFATLNKLVRGDYFGIRRYLLTGADTKSWVLGSPAEKRDALEGIKQISADVDCHPRIQELLIGAVDEMLLNAFIHAAKDDPSTVTVECGADSNILAVAVIDNRGRLDLKDVYGGLETARQRAAVGLPAGLATAGLGFKIMLDSLSQMVVNIEPNRRTEIIGIVDLGKSLREYRKTAPSVGLFRRPG